LTARQKGGVASRAHDAPAGIKQSEARSRASPHATGEETVAPEVRAAADEAVVEVHEPGEGKVACGRRRRPIAGRSGRPEDRIDARAAAAAASALAQVVSSVVLRASPGNDGCAAESPHGGQRLDYLCAGTPCSSRVPAPNGDAVDAVVNGVPFGQSSLHIDLSVRP
jgi:hypothetical protein